MSIDRAIIVHGYSATPADHWFAWLADRLREQGIDTVIPALPGTTAPDRERWVAAVRDALGTADERTAVVAHSLGTVTALHALDGLGRSERLGMFVGVAGFADPLPTLPELDPFVSPAPDLESLATRIRRRVMLHSDDDAIVPPAHSRALGHALDAEIVVVPAAGHFLASQGFTALPTLAELFRHAPQPAAPETLVQNTAGSPPAAGR